MADPQEVDNLLPGVPEGLTNTAEKPAPKKRTPRAKKTKVVPKQQTDATEPASSAAELQKPDSRGKRKIHSETERAEKLARIEKSVESGASIKSAVSQAGISEQTYYQWKKTAAPVPTGDGLKDLVALEAENERLKKMLADRLRKENAELKKKLGLE